MAKSKSEPKAKTKLKTVRSNSKKSSYKAVKRPSNKPNLIDGKHPLIVLRERFSLDGLYRTVNHKNHSTVSLYCARANRDKRLVIPAEWVLPLSVLSGIEPCAMRPDLYEPGWTLSPAPPEPVSNPEPVETVDTVNVTE